jgi:hypothetical protein
MCEVSFTVAHAVDFETGALPHSDASPGGHALAEHWLFLFPLCGTMPALFKGFSNTFSGLDLPSALAGRTPMSPAWLCSLPSCCRSDWSPEEPVPHAATIALLVINRCRSQPETKYVRRDARN